MVALFLMGFQFPEDQLFAPLLPSAGMHACAPALRSIKWFIDKLSHYAWHIGLKPHVQGSPGEGRLQGFRERGRRPVRRCVLTQNITTWTLCPCAMFK